MSDDSSRTEAKRQRGGQPGNRNVVKNALVRSLLNEIAREKDCAKLRAGLGKILDLASTGDLAAMVFIADRLDGRPKQALEHSGADGGPIEVILARLVSREEWLAIHGIDQKRRAATHDRLKL